MLTGNMPFRADSAIASLLKRTQVRADPCKTLNAEIPGALSDVISKCLECDVNNRYSSVAEILRDLETWQGTSSVASLPVLASDVLPAPRVPGLNRKWLLIGGAALAIAVAAGVPFALTHYRARAEHCRRSHAEHLARHCAPAERLQRSLA